MWKPISVLRKAGVSLLKARGKSSLRIPVFPVLPVSTCPGLSPSAATASSCTFLFCPLKRKSCCPFWFHAGSISRIAGNFAVKESVAKALGTGFAGFGMTDIEVFRDEKGRPCAVLRGGAERRFRELGGRAVHVSISDTKEYCIAVAILEG